MKFAMVYDFCHTLWVFPLDTLLRRRLTKLCIEGAKTDVKKCFRLTILKAFPYQNIVFSFIFIEISLNHLSFFCKVCDINLNSQLEIKASF